MTATTTVELKIPQVFFDDHVSRGLVSTTDTPITKTLSKHYVVVLTTNDTLELISDALHYTTPGMFEWDYQYLVSSARATLNAIRKQLTYDEVISWCTSTGPHSLASTLRRW